MNPEKNCYKLLLNSKVFCIKNYFKRLTYVSQDIYNCLIQEKQYIVESKVSDETFQQFIDYWQDKTKIPNISPQNFYEYFELNQEFGDEIMGRLIQENEEKYGQSYQHIKNICLNKSDSNNTESETIISKNLDFYLNEYKNEMIQIRITSLYNIFNNKERNLMDHNLAYSFINFYSQQKNDPNIFILLPSIDLNKLNQKFVDESFELKNEHFGFMPNKESRDVQNNYPLNFLYAGPSQSLPGILYYLNKKQENKFDRLFIASQGSRDIYCLIDPKSDDNFNTANQKVNFIQFEFKNEIQINGIKICSANNSFPRSFDILINDNTVKQIRNANELNGKNKEMTINFDENNAKSVRLLFIDKNWNNDNFVVGLKRVEFLSPNQEYSQGVFAKLVDECENNDPHRCDVLLSASDFDFNSFFLVDSKRRILTYKTKAEFQIEMTKGTVIIHAIRMRNNKIKSFKIVASDNKNKKNEEWFELINVREKPKKDDKKSELFELNHPSPPVRFVRVIQTEPTWNGDERLIIYHFDIFGYYL